MPSKPNVTDNGMWVYYRTKGERQVRYWHRAYCEDRGQAREIWEALEKAGYEMESGEP